MSSKLSSVDNKIKLKVWDLPTRIFHWGTIGLLGALWWSADVGEMQWHQIFAYSLMVLIIFRVLWGFIGSDTARFSHFVKPPKQVIGYLKQPTKATLGHNPLGGYMVVTMMVILLVQLGSGLFATDEVFTEGPLYRYVSSDLSSALTWLHKMNFNVLLALAAMHILAVIVHGFKGDKLVGAMITGYKYVTKDMVAELRFRSNFVALILVGILMGLVVNYLILPLTVML